MGARVNWVTQPESLDAWAKAIAPKTRFLYVGPSLSPFNAWLFLPGLEHLPLRMERHCANALPLAAWLEQHPLVELVNYPGLPSNPYHPLVAKQMKGCSSLLSFVPRGTYDDAVKVIDALELWTHATHLGTCKTIVTHPASTTHSAMGEAEMRKAGIPPTLIRVSVGIEDEADIIADIEQALAKRAVKCGCEVAGARN